MKTQETFRSNSAVLNIESASHDSFSVHWSAIFAGLFVATLSYIALMSLGLAVGANTMRDVISGEASMGSVGAGTGLWMIFSALFSLFLGSYASGRVSGIIATRVGYIQGAVITALFFLMMLSQIGVGVGLIGKGIGNLSSSAASGATELAKNDRLNGFVEDAVAGMDLRAPATQVVQGVVSRLIRGDTESAKNYLAAQAGISRADAETRIDTFNAQFTATMKDVGNRTAEIGSMVGWTAFLTIILGTIAAMFGGAAGALMNMRRPLGKADVHYLQQTHRAYTA